ncbi:hypothetical protein CDAR_172601 [Caerostris darwini]|uniref:Uncharacterized protein n=1 Tax=Caerostris darwini TaxID=1538125 RepID=A0AAV4MFY4_9ARAC|nr:hypothetical protein CDAR_172601 [Caerostris darwini]
MLYRTEGSISYSLKFPLRKMQLIFGNGVSLEGHLMSKDEIWISTLRIDERHLAAEAEEHEKQIYDMHAATMDASETIYFHEICDKSSRRYFPESETTDLSGAHWTDVEMDFLMHFGALLNRLMLLRFVKCGGRLICGRIRRVFRKVSRSFRGEVEYF